MRFSHVPFDIFVVRLTQVLLVLTSVIALSACAGSQDSNADEVRARAHGGYDALDREIDDGSSANSWAATKPATSTRNGGDFIQVDDSKSMMEHLALVSCADASFIKGFGIADDPRKALLQAQKSIAEQIQSEVSSKTEMSVQENEYGKDVATESSYSMKAMVSSRLENAQDAKAIANLKQGAQFGVVACMSKTDAATPFMRDFETLRDSTLLLSKIFAEQNHPVEKNNAYKQAKDAFARMLAAEHILQGLGVNAQNEAKDAFKTMQKDYNVFRSQYAFYFSSNGTEGEPAKWSGLVFQRLAANYAVQNAACEMGLKLTLTPSNVECKEGSLGISCVLDMNLNGSSCQGESFFALNAKVKGVGRYDEDEARARLEENVKAGDWFEEWKSTLDLWRLE